MESERSLPHSQVPATCPYPEPDQSSLCSPFHFINIAVLVLGADIVRLIKVQKSNGWGISKEWTKQDQPESY